MTIIKIITITALIILSSSTEGMVVVINFPDIISQFLGLKPMLLNTLISPVQTAYSNSGTLSSEESDNDSNKDQYKIDKWNHRKSGNDNLDDLNILKISFEGLQKIAAALRALRRASLTKRHSPLSESVLANMVGIDEKETNLKMDNTLKSLIELNKKRNQLINEFNIKFPGLFDGSSPRRAQETKPFVELGPGSIKTEIVTYPPNFLASRLKHLLKIKKKQEAQNA